MHTLPIFLQPVSLLFQLSPPSPIFCDFVPVLLLVGWLLSIVIVLLLLLLLVVSNESILF
jgi:hypothetical protein